MKNSVTVRNLTGCFLGGVVGILTSWYLMPLLLPLGVLLGVVVGWWAKDIALAFVGSYRTAFNFWQWIMTPMSKKSLPWQDLIKQAVAFPQLIIGKVGVVIASIYWHIKLPFHWTATLIRIVVSVPRHIMHWRIHPTRKALLISIGAIMIGVVLNVVAIVVLVPWPETHMTRGGLYDSPLKEVPFSFWKIVVSASIITLFISWFGILHFAIENEKNSAMRNFYTRWERYSQYSSFFTYFVREVFRFFKAEVLGLVFIVAIVAYIAILGGAIIAFITIPVVVFVTFMVSLYKIAQRSAHWWCLGVTLVVTTASAIIFYRSFENEILLWTIALGTGVVSGIATEGLRRLGVWWGATKIGQYYLNIWYDDDKELPFSIAVPAWRKFSKMFNGITECLIISQ